MRKSLLLILVGVSVSVTSLLLSTNEITGDTNGPPSGRAAAPSDNFNDCTDCHNSTVTNVAGWITSNIPASGYVAGTTYTITATATYAGLVRFGFEISPQNASGVKLGTLVITNSTTTQLVGSSKYVEHKSAGTTGTTGYHTWSFNWIAPVAGSGPVNFYGSFNCANNNGSDNGDHIYNSVMYVVEGGCSISTTVTASGPTTFCAGGSVTLNAGSGFSTYHWSNNASTQTINATASGTYSVTVTNSTGCSAVASSPAIVVNSAPSVPVITPNGPTSFCTGGSVTLSATSGATTYHWSNNASTQTINVTTAGSYSVTVTNAGGCSAVSTATTVTISTPPSTPVITPSGPTTFCSGGSVTLSATSGATTYHWTNNAATQTINVTTGGSYMVTVTNAGGCQAVSTATPVVVNSAPAVPVITPSGATSFCQGGSVTLSATSGASTYHWSTNTTTQTINVSTAGSYSVTVTNNGGCQAVSTPTVVTVNPLPTTTISGSSTLCAGSSSVLNAGSGFSAYHWSTNAVTQTITVSTAGIFAVTVTNATGCTGTASITVTVGSGLSPTITGSPSICSGGSSVLNAGAGYNTYHWSNNATTQTITVTAAGTYGVTVTSASGCSGSTSINVTVGTNPTPSISGSTSICTGSSSVLNAGTGYTTYHWSNNATTQTITVTTAGTYGVTVTNSTGCSGTASVIVTVGSGLSPTIAGSSSICSGTSTVLNSGTGYSTYHWSTNATTQNITVSTAGTYSVTVTNSSGCSGTASKTVTVNASPTPTITGTSAICGGSSTVLHAGAGYASYHWSTGSTNQNITVSTAGTYSVTVTNASSCSASTSKTVTVGAVPSPSISASGSTAICQGGIVTLDVSNNFAAYNWSNGSTTHTINAGVSGSYSLVVTNSSGCTGLSNTIDVSISDTPICAAAVSPPTICNGESTMGNVTTGDIGWTYIWNPGGIPGLSVNLFPSVSTTYVLTATNSANCSTSVSIPVTVLDAPSFPIILQSGSILTAAASNANNYQWYLNGVEIIGATDISYDAGSQSGDYTVIVGNSSGCKVESAYYFYQVDGISYLNNLSLSIYPNPFNSFISIQNLKGENEIVLMSIQGSVIYSNVSSAEKETINTSELAVGFYLLQVKSESGLSISKVVKN